MSQREVGDVDVIRVGGSLRLLDERGREREGGMDERGRGGGGMDERGREGRRNGAMGKCNIVYILTMTL